MEYGIFKDDEKVEDFIFDDAKIENKKILKTAADICSICQVGLLKPEKDPTKVGNFALRWQGSKSL